MAFVPFFSFLWGAFAPLCAAFSFLGGRFGPYPAVLAFRLHRSRPSSGGTRLSPLLVFFIPAPWPFWPLGGFSASWAGFLAPSFGVSFGSYLLS